MKLPVLKGIKEYIIVVCTFNHSTTKPSAESILTKQNLSFWIKGRLRVEYGFVSFLVTTFTEQGHKSVFIYLKSF